MDHMNFLLPTFDKHKQNPCGRHNEQKLKESKENLKYSIVFIIKEK